MINGPSQRHGEIAILLGAGVWGLFWIPLHYLNNNNVDGLWAVALILLCGVPVSLGMALYRKDFARKDISTTAVIGVLIGLAVTFYFSALVYTDVIRVVFLFYLLPIWATLLDRLIYSEPIGRRRMFAIIIALFGLWQMLGDHGGWPIPQNIGDWMAIASGVSWASCLVVIKRKPEIGTLANSAATFLVGSILAVGAALLLEAAPFPLASDISSNWVPALLFATLLMWPSIVGQVWGARLIPASRAALLTMVEILVATSSAYLLIGTAISLRAAFGGVLIIIAVLIDLSAQSSQKRELSNEQGAV